MTAGRTPTSMPADADTIAQELFVFTLGGEGRHELERVVASDYSRAQINDQAAVDELRRACCEQVERRGCAGEGGVRWHGHRGHDHRLRPAVQHARSLPRHVAVQQLRRPPSSRCSASSSSSSARLGSACSTIAPNVLPVLAVLGRHGLSRHLDEHRHRDGRQRRARRRRRRHDSFHQPLSTRGRRRRGHRRAIEIATAHEGRASLTTAIINSCGFGVLLLSEYKPTAWFGGLLALTMAVAFLAEVFILPATIKLLPAFRRRGRLRCFGGKGAGCGRPAVRIGLAQLAVRLWRCRAWRSPLRRSRPPATSRAVLDYLPNRSTRSSCARGPSPRRSSQPSQRLTSRPPGSSRGCCRATVRRLRRQANGRVDRGSSRAGRQRRRSVAKRLDVLAGFASRRLGTPRRAAADRCHQSARRVAVLLRRPQRGAACRWRSFARGVFAGDELTLEGVYVPIFRRGRFDQLDEPTSPFNLAGSRRRTRTCLAIGCPTLPVVLVETSRRLQPANAQGGARLSGTAGSCRLERRRHIAASSRSGCPARKRRPAILRRTFDPRSHVPAVHDDRRRLRDRARRSGVCAARWPHSWTTTFSSADPRSSAGRRSTPAWASIARRATTASADRAPAPRVVR